MQRSLFVLLVACSSHTGAAPDAPAVDCGGLAETACNAELECYAVYSSNSGTGQPGGVFASCAAGSAVCSLSTGSSVGGCDYGDVSCPQGFAVAFADGGDCTKGFSIMGCVHDDKCN